MAILPAVKENSQVAINFDFKYDFVPCNEEFLRRMRLDFIHKKERVTKYVFKKLMENDHKNIFLVSNFQNDYQEWKKKID
jgi:hypothetical protein